MEPEETRSSTASSVLGQSSSRPSDRSLRIVDVVVNLLQRDRITEALDCQLVAVAFALDNDMTTEDAMRLSLDEMTEMMPPPPPVIPYVPQVRGRWDKVYYGEAAFRSEEP